MYRRQQIAVGLTLLLSLSVNCGTPDYVGSRDCAKLVKELDIPWFTEKCGECQGKACEEEGYCKLNFPCQDGGHVVQGCEEDSDCADLKAICAKFMAQPHNVCSLLDSI